MSTDGRSGGALEIPEGVWARYIELVQRRINFQETQRFRVVVLDNPRASKST